MKDKHLDLPEVLVKLYTENEEVRDFFNSFWLGIDHKAKEYREKKKIPTWRSKLGLEWGYHKLTPEQKIHLKLKGSVTRILQNPMLTYYDVVDLFAVTLTVKEITAIIGRLVTFSNEFTKKDFKEISRIMDNLVRTHVRGGLE